MASLFPESRLPRRSPAASAEPGAGAQGASPEGSEPLTVSLLSGRIKQVIAEGFASRIRVVGELSNFSARGGAGHWYFSLKDAEASIRCVMFASSARRVRFAPADGQQVVLTGRVDYYGAQGSIQLYAEGLEPVGAGALELELRRLVEELRERGYLDPAAKKPLPVMAETIAVVTSRDAAALQDVINTARRRWPGCRLLLLDVRVQGPQAAPGIAAAIQALSRHGERLGIDAVILTRGGGSMEDLWAFNDRQVAEAIHICPLPIVAAIGHETDVTVAELVADHRCATPTQAAMTLVPDAAALRQQLEHLEHRLRLVIRRGLESSRHRLERAARHPLFVHPQRLIGDERRRLEAGERRLIAALPRRAAEAGPRLERLERRLQGALPRRAALARQELERWAERLQPQLRRRLERHREHLEVLFRHLEAVGPSQVLSRGYSLTLGPDGRLLRSVAAAAPGMKLFTVLADGRLESTVTEESASAPPPRITAPRQRTRRVKKPSQNTTHNPPHNPGLFDTQA